MRKKVKTRVDWQVEAKAGGVYLPQVDFWMDPKKPQRRALVTHAHYDHLAAHGEILASSGTAELLKVRVPKGTKIRAIEFGESYSLGKGACLTLYPAGHILGSSMALVEVAGHGNKKSRLLYTGDFKLRKGLSAEACQPVRADVLVMETTFGLPQYRMPPAEKVIGEMLEFCRENLAQGKVPVLLGYALGKSQEIMCALAREKWPLLLHPSIQTMAGIYRKLGVSLPEGRTLNATTGKKAEGHVVLCPPQTVRSKGLQKLEPKKTAMLSGWALERGAIYRYGCDAAFPLSDHADYDELWEMVGLVQPQQVRTLHGFAREFAMDLQEKGIEAWALTGDTQMVLPI